MSDFESDSLSTPANLPNDEEIESTLRLVVRDALKRDEEITVKRARGWAEEALGLHSGFFKDDAEWKTRSNDLIHAAIEEPESPEKKDVRKVKAKAGAGTKRKSDELEERKWRKKRKRSPIVDSEESENGQEPNEPAEDAEDAEPEDVKPKKSQPKSEEESALSDPPDEESEPAALKQNGKPAAAADDDDSDLSSVLDDPPPKAKKSRQKKSTSPKPTKSKATSTATKSKSSKPSDKPSDLSPQEEELKRLQSWLLKCGIRKLWHRELAPFSSPKEKISHLKSMLEDVGMTGRFSVEKARQIKEQRELKAELEAARAFNSQWGDGEEEEGGGGKGEAGDGEGEDEDGAEVKQPVRRLKPKGLVDFGDSDEESE